VATPRAVVILDPAFLGDVVFDGPLVRALHAADPLLRVGMLVRPPADAIARLIVGVDSVHRYDKYRADRGLAGLRRMAAELAEARYDTALIPHPSARTTLLARWAGIPRRIGNAGWPARLWLTDPRPTNPGDTHIRARLRLLDSQANPDLYGTMTRRHRPPPGARRIALALGANWATKRWPPERAAHLAQRLADAGHVLVLVGSAAERTLADELRRYLRPGTPVVDAMGGSIEELLEQLARCHLVVGGDTGPVHAARALGLPAVMLFGPTPEAAHDLGPTDVVVTVSLPCRPCDAHGPARCPLVHHRCMRDLDVEQIYDAVARLLVGCAD
jgi:ADP-heptose:LPS heptosyltransferase